MAFGHGGIFNALTGKVFRNCEIARYAWPCAPSLQTVSASMPAAVAGRACCGRASLLRVVEWQAFELPAASATELEGRGPERLHTHPAKAQALAEAKTNPFNKHPQNQGPSRHADTRHTPKSKF